MLEAHKMSTSPPNVAARQARRDQFVVNYEPLIAPIVRRIKATLPASFAADDLRQIGAMALLPIADGIESYVWRRVRGAILDYVRENYRMETCVSIGCASTLANNEPDYAGQIDLASAVSALPDRERSAIEMKLSGASIHEISATLKVTGRTVKRRNISAIRKLRASLAA